MRESHLGELGSNRARVTRPNGSKSGKKIGKQRKAYMARPSKTIDT